MDSLAGRPNDVRSDALMRTGTRRGLTMRAQSFDEKTPPLLKSRAGKVCEADLASRGDLEHCASGQS